MKKHCNTEFDIMLDEEMMLVEGGSTKVAAGICTIGAGLCFIVSGGASLAGNNDLAAKAGIVGGACGVAAGVLSCIPAP